MYACTCARGEYHRRDGKLTAGQKKRANFPGEGSPGGVRGGYKQTTIPTPTTPMAKGLANLFLYFYLSIFRLYIII